MTKHQRQTPYFNALNIRATEFLNGTLVYKAYLTLSGVPMYEIIITDSNQASCGGYVFRTQFKHLAVEVLRRKVAPHVSQQEFSRLLEHDALAA